jgi:hypothetical protein
MTPTETVLEEFAIPVSLYSIVEDMANEIVTLRISRAERDIWQNRALRRIALQAENDGLRARLDACEWVVEVASKLGEQYGRQHLSAAIYAYRSQRDAKTEADQ